jgi:hypothetical protein
MWCVYGRSERKAAHDHGADDDNNDDDNDERRATTTTTAAATTTTTTTMTPTTTKTDERTITFRAHRSASTALRLSSSVARYLTCQTVKIWRPR